ncbi:MAG: 4-vinyl reductase [Thermoplasmata archaeon]|nr:MAG: 4-vinyl reductase [Thermoplasmata archaeon]
MNEQLRISGDNLTHALEFIRRKKGIEGLNWIVSETGKTIEDIYPEKMYPFEMYIDLLEVINSNFEHNDPNIIFRIGFDRAKTLEFFEYHKKKTDPITIFNMMQSNWSRFNDFGKIEIKKESESSATIYICDYPANPLYCKRMEGFLEGIISAVCGRNDAFVEEVKCRGKGDKFCKFETSWREPKRNWS